MRESEGAILPSTLQKLLSGEMSCQIGLVTYSAVNLWTLPNTSQGVGILPRQCTHPDMGRDGISRFFFLLNNANESENQSLVAEA